HRAGLSRRGLDRRDEPVGGPGNDAAVRVDRRALSRRAEVRDSARARAVARWLLPAGALSADLPQGGPASLRRRADPPDGPIALQAVPHRTRRDRRRAPAGAPRVRVATAAL